MQAEQQQQPQLQSAHRGEIDAAVVEELKQQLQRTLLDVETLKKEKEAMRESFAEKQQQVAAASGSVHKETEQLIMKISELTAAAAAAAAAAEKEKKDLNLKISELSSSLKTAAAKEARAASSRTHLSADEEKNKTIAQQSAKIAQLEGTLCKF
jgi:chromosome segregation ATPase